MKEADRYRKYRIAILALLAVVVMQGIFLLFVLAKWPFPKVAKPVLAPGINGRIAIVIDDWGYNLNNLAFVKQIKYPFTVSILPNLEYSKAVAERLHLEGKEIILHLPMQPNEETSLEKDTILVSMTEQEIENIFAEALKSIPYARGVSNHMGSRVTEDARVTGILFSQIKKRGLFFLDSLTSFKSVCSTLAYEFKIPFVERDTFIDNETERGYIKQQLYKLAAKAKLKGAAIGIGHDRRITFETLKEVMPKLKKEGYEFVFLSELAR